MRRAGNAVPRLQRAKGSRAARNAARLHASLRSRQRPGELKRRSSGEPPQKNIHLQSVLGSASDDAKRFPDRSALKDDIFCVVSHFVGPIKFEATLVRVLVRRHFHSSLPRRRGADDELLPVASATDSCIHLGRGLFLTKSGRQF
jgi:hypothetical protein